tara:strand:+ start:5 stop:940 length:936 start_codon:yes stop_codon:yes gene_type:complete
MVQQEVEFNRSETPWVVTATHILHDSNQFSQQYQRNQNLIIETSGNSGDIKLISQNGLGNTDISSNQVNFSNNVKIAGDLVVDNSFTLFGRMIVSPGVGVGIETDSGIIQELTIGSNTLKIKNNDTNEEIKTLMLDTQTNHAVLIPNVDFCNNVMITGDLEVRDTLRVNILELDIMGNGETGLFDVSNIVRDISNNLRGGFFPDATIGYNVDNEPQPAIKANIIDLSCTNLQTDSLKVDNVSRLDIGCTVNIRDKLIIDDGAYINKKLVLSKKFNYTSAPNNSTSNSNLEITNLLDRINALEQRVQQLEQN